MLTGTAQPPALLNGAFPSTGGSGVFAGFADGTAAAPGAYWISEPSLGFYRAAAGIIDIGIGGVRSFRFETNGKLTGAGTGFITLGVADSIVVSPAAGSFFQVDQNARFADGAVGTPGITFFNDTDTGLYRVGANGVGLASGGVIVGGWDTAGQYGGNGSSGCAALSAATGSAASPCFTFKNDTDTGIFASGANEIALVAGGTSRVFVNANGLTINSGTIGLVLSAGRILRLGNAYVAVAPGAATGTVTIQDSTGTTYRVPVLV